MEKKQKDTRFRAQMRRAVKSAGEWIAAHADEIIPEVDGLKTYTLKVDFDAGEFPGIMIEAEYINSEMVEAFYLDGEEDGEESDMEKKDQGGM